MTTSVQGTLRRIQDSNGADYLAVVLNDCALLQAGRSHLVGMGLEKAIEARDTRDGVDNAHVTIMTVAEWGGVRKHKPELLAMIEPQLKTPVSMEFHGLGNAMATNMVNQAWYGILSCDAMTALRHGLGIKAKELHVTMAFSPKDVFDASKGLATMIIPAEQLLNRSTAYDADIDYGGLGL